MRVGSLFHGVGGLDLGLQMVGPTELVWYSENDKHLIEWGEVRYPGVPNLGDITEIDELPPVDVITAGFPCQPVSQAGERKGVDDARWLFDEITRLVGAMDAPPWLFLENVPGLLAESDAEPFRRVLFGLAEIGFVGRYGVVAASDVGAPHLRRRWFCVAHHADADPRRWDRWGWGNTEAGGWEEFEDGGGVARNADILDSQGRHPAGQSWKTRSAAGRAAVSDADDAGRGEQWGTGAASPEFVSFERGGAVVADSGGREPERQRGLRIVGGSAADADREGVQRERAGDAVVDRDADVSDADSDGREERGLPDRHETADLPDPERCDWFGPHWSAIERWERVLGRECRATPLNGSRRLNERFVEYIMGYEPGWACDVLKRRPALRALGNAVVPQQAAAAWRLFSTPEF